ncbi:MAG: hypothetical protein WDN69_06260 [Aliidongia sp.]
MMDDVVEHPNMVAGMAGAVCGPIAGDAAIRDAVSLKSIVAVDFEAIDNDEIRRLFDAPQMAAPGRQGRGNRPAFRSDRRHIRLVSAHCRHFE